MDSHYESALDEKLSLLDLGTRGNASLHLEHFPTLP